MNPQEQPEAEWSPIVRAHARRLLAQPDPWSEFRCTNNPNEQEHLGFWCCNACCPDALIHLKDLAR